MGVIEATNIKYSDNGQRLFIEQSDGEFLNIDKENVLSVTKKGSEYAENPDAEFLNYKLTDEKKLVWQKIFETELSFEELQEYFTSVPFTSDLEIKNERIMGWSQKTTLSSSKGLAMIAKQPYTAFVTIDFKQGKYRVTIRDLKFNPMEVSGFGASGGMGIGISSDVHANWQDLAVRDNHHEIRKNNAAKKFLTTLDSDLKGVFTANEKSSEDW